MTKLDCMVCSLAWLGLAWLGWAWLGLLQNAVNGTINPVGISP